MTLEDMLKDAVAAAMGATIANEVHAIVVRETRHALHDHEDQIAAIVRAAVNAAFEDMLK